MDFAELAATRYSVRKYAKTPIARETIETVLEAGRIAPSACNFQPWRFLVLTDPARRQAMSEVYHQAWFADAPVIIGVFLDTTKTWKRADGKDYGDVDVAIAMDHMILQATELGLGTCWIGAFDVQKAKSILSVPDGLEPIVFTPLGYPASEQPPKRRKEMDEIVSWETF